jgi:2-dehydro-3-deoxyglucarate aldolase/4-hydroxy-2-oxoheptanedioate aldolase
MSGARPSELRRRIAGGEALSGAFVNLGGSLTSEIMSIAGYDWLVIDLEHGAGDEHVLTRQLQAVGSSTATIVRVEGVDSARVLHALDLGADGVLVPRLRTVEQARECVSYCRYAGERGVARYNRAWHWGLAQRTLAEVDDEVVCAVQIETPEALAAVEEIAAVEGVDVLFVGPADLAHGLGLHCPPDAPELLVHARRVADAARAHGKAAGMLVGTVEQARRYREIGFTFLGCGSDGSLLAVAARAMADQLRELTLVPNLPERMTA